MSRVWRDPDADVRDRHCCIVQSASESCAVLFDQFVELDQSNDDPFWLIRRQMNGYNVHDGAFEEVMRADF